MRNREESVTLVHTHSHCELAQKNNNNHNCVDLVAWLEVFNHDCARVCVYVRACFNANVNKVYFSFLTSTDSTELSC